MIKTKYVLTFLLSALFMLTISSCKKCKNEDPMARIVNGSKNKVSVQIKTSGGNTVNINNVQPNSSSDYESFASGDITFTIALSNGKTFVEKVYMDDCFNYDISVDNNGNITTYDDDRNN